jgi:hypothetical protein
LKGHDGRVIIAAAKYPRGVAMIRVVLRDGSCQDVAEAVDGERRGHEIILSGRRGEVVARFDCSTLLAYGPPETLPGRPVVAPKASATAVGGCAHAWVRLKNLEEVLDVVVFVRECTFCGRVDAKAGHRDPVSEESWVPIASGLHQAV